MKSILAENMLRFGVKNLTESNVNNILQLLTEQNEDLTDWSEGGKETWEKAKLELIIKFVKEVDAKSGGSFLNMPEYEAMMAWFAKNDSKETRASLKAWVFDNIVFGGAKQPEVKKKDQKEDLGTISQALTNLEQIITVPQLYSDTNIANNLKKYIQRLQQEIKAYNAKGLSFTDSDDVRDFIKQLMLIGSDVKIVINKIKNSSNTNVKLDKAGDSFWEDAEYYSSVKEILEYFVDIFSGEDAGLAKILTVDTDGGDLKVDMTKSGANLSQIKTNVISSLQKSVIDAEGKKALSNFSKAIMAAKSISITNQMSEIKSGWSEYTEITKEATMSDISSPIFCFPPLNIPEGEQRNAMGRSMFADNSISVSSQAETALNAQIQAAAAFIQEYQQKVEAIKAQVNTDVPDMEIISFQYSAYSSTSTVNTTYGDKRGRSNKANNIPLATGRYNAMIAKMKELIENNDTLNEFDVEGPSEQFLYPNVGPEWMSVGGKLPDGTQITIKDYGPLFQQAYARDPKITPQRFYGLRSTPQLKQEYESVYAKYRQSTCAFTIQLRIPELLAKQEVIQDFLVGGTPEMLIDVQFPAGVDWTGMKRKFKRGVKKIGTGIKKMGGGSRSGGAPMPVFKGRSTGCPSWG